MKIVRYLSSGGLCLLVTLGAARGDAASPDDAALANPYAAVDPDGVPMAVTQKPAKAPSQDDIDSYRKEQERAMLDKDWLLRSYEQQVQRRAAANRDSDGSGNLYYQLSSNKELAKLAGLPSINASSDNKEAMASRATSPADVTSSGNGATLPAQAPRGFLKPLITPLSAPEVAGLHNFYATIPLAVSPLFPSTTANTGDQNAPAPQADSSVEPSPLDTPGLTAAQADPALDDKPESDLSLDVLPGESIQNARQHQDNYSKLELSLPPSAEEPATAPTAALLAPGTAKATTSTAVKQPLVTDPNTEPTPVSKIIQPVPARATIGNPNDIFYR